MEFSIKRFSFRLVNIPNDTTIPELTHFLEQHTPIKRVNMTSDSHYVLVEFYSKDDMKKAMKQFNGLQWKGNILFVLQ